jgi:hypothetical protein
VDNNEDVAGLRAQMDMLKARDEWPKTRRITKFSSGLFADVRLKNALGFCHEMVKRVDDRNIGKNCALCSYGNQKRTSHFWCRICEVHLCTTPITANSRKTCTQQWHALPTLKTEAANRNRQVASLQTIKRGKKRQSSERDDNPDDMVNDENAPPPSSTVSPEQSELPSTHTLEAAGILSSVRRSDIGDRDVADM